MRTLLFVAIICSFVLHLSAQNKPIAPSKIVTGVFLGETKALRDIPPLTADELQAIKQKAEAKILNKKLQFREYPYAETALPKGPDAVWQRSMGTSGSVKVPAKNFEGQSSPYYPPDCNGAVGPNHFMQTVNCTYAIYDKSGTKLVGPNNMNTLFNGVTGSNYNDGDPIVLFDEQANRFVAAEFSISGSNNYQMIAVSATSDPTGTWYAYSFDVDDMPDYPKFSVWQDGYYMGDNNSSGKDIYVLERAKMLTGATGPQMVGFNNNWRPGSVDGFMCVPPVDNDGPFAPAGSPGLFIAMVDDAFNSGSPDQLWIYELAVNWTTPTASTFNRVQQLNVAPFDSNFGSNWNNIKQKGTSQKVDAIPQVIMNVPQYRNFGAYQTIVCCHTVDVDNTDHAGVRWYELRKTPPSTDWEVRQQGTYAPDGNSRWLGSIMLNGFNSIGLGYSVSGSNMYPGLRFCGQTAAEYANASGILDFPEDTIIEGGASQTSQNRWGDYSQMSVDPSDDGTFWFTSEYINAGSRNTKIASFLIGPLLPSATISADNTLPCKDSTTVNFSCATTGSPTSFEWSFTPNTVTYQDGTNSSSQDPHVAFNALGIYSVSLTVANTAGSKTVDKPSFIKVNAANANFNVNATTVVVSNDIVFDDASTCTVNSWHWDFGEGAVPATAETQGPHTVSYSTTGLKTVTLTVNGGSTMTKTEYINVIDANINMTTATVAACNGSFFDQGGVSANYANNLDNSMLFKPGIPGAKVKMDFTSFDLEASTSCTKDYLKIYDGPSMFSPLFGTYCGSNSPGTVTATNAAGVLLFVFHSNATVNAAGWEATVSCTDIPVASPMTLTATAQSSSKIDLNWTKNPNNDNVLLLWSLDGTFGMPVQGTSYAVGTVVLGGGTVLASGAATSISHTGLTSSTKYYYRAFSFDATTKYSDGIDANATTLFQPTLSVDPLVLNVPAPTGSSNVNIMSNTNWTVVSDQTWCTAAPSGTGNQALAVAYTENLAVTARVAHLTITVAGLPVVHVTVNQAAAAPLLSVTPPNQDVTDPSGNTQFTVHSNTDWTVTSDQTWCTVNASGTGNGTITATFAQNISIHSRKANISVTVNGLSTIIVTVTQAGAAIQLDVQPPVINVNAYATASEYTVTSNTDWTVTSDSAWCVVTGTGTGNGTINAVYPWNSTGKNRSATISVTAGGTTTKLVTIKQSQEVAGIPDNASRGLSIQPNPAKGLFSIVVDKTKYPDMQVTISDSKGAIVISRHCAGEAEYAFDLSNSPQGTYFIKIKTDTELLMSKMMIVK